MISKLPAWVWGIAFVLAAIAGMVNVIGLLGFDHQAVTHLTGSTSLLSEALAEGLPGRALHFAAIIGAFVCGTVISGFVVKDNVLKLGRAYGVALLLESLLLFAAMLLLKRHNAAGMYAAACASGLQNAMVSTYSGTVVRTTHISGMFTDLGIFLGQRMRGLQIDGRRARLCFSVIGGFFVGGVAGAALFHRFEFATLWIPILATAVAGWSYTLRNAAEQRTPDLN